MRFTNVVIAAAIAAATTALWAFADATQPAPAWPERVAGMSFQPMRADDDPVLGRFPTTDEIAADVEMLKTRAHSIRTYSVEGSLGEIPEIARRYGTKVTLGVWISADIDRNEREMVHAIDLARRHPNVVRIVVGNEALWRGELTADELIVYLDRMRRAVNVPVSTAEPWHVWLKHPELAGHADYVAVHILPYWEGIALDNAVRYVEERYNDVRAAFPHLHVLIGEVGWPSDGRTRRDAVASGANQAEFLRKFLSLAEWRGYDYYLMEAFDQPWKMGEEGAVGGYWGIYDVNRQAKFAFTDPIQRMPQWPILAAASVVLAGMALAVIFMGGSNLRRRGLSFLAITAHVVAACIVWVGNDIASQYLTPVNAMILTLLLAGFVLVTVVLLTEAHEMAEANWAVRRRPFAAVPTPVGYRPKVSIHVPCYNEPPHMVIETLNALARLDYPDFEVLVIDNNTRDPAVWQPVGHHCALLGSRFRFFHVDPLAGYKAGALNLALGETADDAEIIAVIDSDYVVSPEWLRALVPHFERPNVGIVQAPQDYRDGGESLFKRMCVDEYAGFFHIGMVTRNDRNAIIEHGTMTMMRRKVLEDVGRWAEWCITEDAELGLRILEHGYDSVYVADSYGKGLSPDTFVDYKKQRFRWAYGAIQILRRHAGDMFGRRSRLTRGQRYHFVAGWLPWISDGLNLFFTAGALIWAAALALDPAHVDSPPLLFTLPPIALFVFKVLKTSYLYRTRLRADFKTMAGAALAGLALSHTIARAVLQGFVTTGMPFFRTPKCEHQPALVRALRGAAEETCLMLALWCAALAVGLLAGRESPDAMVWAWLMGVQSLPYLAAVVMALINAWPVRTTAQPRRDDPVAGEAPVARAA